MATNVLSPPSLDPDSTRVLAAYSAAEPVVPADAGDDEGAGWIPRLAVIEQVLPERLPPVHGKLIALGLLKFQLLDRSGGMVYRLTPEGRSVLASTLGQEAPPLTETASGPEDRFALEDDRREWDEETVDTPA